MIGLIPGASAMIARNITLLKWLIPVGALAAAGFYVWSLHGALDRAKAAIETQRAQLDQATAANASLNETLDRRDRWQARQLATLSADRDAALTRTATTTKIIEVIRHAPPSDDAPLAPVLRSALDGLRGARTAPGGAKPSGAAGDPARPPDLPGKP